MQLLTNLAMPLAILSKCLLPSVLAAPTPAPQAIALNVVDDTPSEPSTAAEASSPRLRQCLPSLSNGGKMQQGDVACAEILESRQAIHGAVEAEGLMRDGFEMDEEEEEKEKAKRQVTSLDMGTTDGM